MPTSQKIIFIVIGLLWTSSTVASQESQPESPLPASELTAETLPALPASQDVISACIEAMGGRDAIDAIKSISAEGTMTTDNGEMTVFIQSSSKGKFLITRSGDAMEEITVGCDGSVAWLYDPAADEYQLLDENQAAHMKLQSNMHRLVLNFHETYQSIQTIDEVQFNGHNCYRIGLSNNNTLAQYAYFNSETKLIEGFESLNQKKSTESEITVRFNEWQEIDGTKVLATMTVQQGGSIFTLHFNEIKFNEVDESNFALPSEARDLVKARGRGR